MVTKMTQSNNPLRKHFRQPVIYLKLPSGGKLYPPGTLQVTENGELPIFPMTALDEITNRTPDALFNGSAVTGIIKSCVPNILDPWNAPVTDFNALLVAIRIASYGHKMDINSTCPKCNATHDFDIDLRAVLDQLRSPDYDKTLVDGDLTFYFVPMTYKQVNENSKITFEDQKTIQILSNTDITEEEKLVRLSATLKNITTATFKSIAQSIGAIKTPELLVTEQEHIEDFLRNCTKSVFELIRIHITELRKNTDLPPINIVCDSCQHAYEQVFTLDMSNFFEVAS